MGLVLAGAVVGAAAVLAAAVGLALVLEVDRWEQGWESEGFHQVSTVDPPEAHAEDGPP